MCCILYAVLSSYNRYVREYKIILSIRFNSKYFQTNIVQINYLRIHIFFSF